MSGIQPASEVELKWTAPKLIGMGVLTLVGALIVILFFSNLLGEHLVGR